MAMESGNRILYIHSPNPEYRCQLGFPSYMLHLYPAGDELPSAELS
jgi:hypothetical protein